MKRILVMVVLATTACSTVRATSIRMGRMYPAQGSTCDLRFENLTFQEASAKYEQIGLVQLTGTGEAQPQGWEGDTKAQLAPKACEMAVRWSRSTRRAGARTSASVWAPA